jgi:UDP-N-acetylmuramate--alanine ligase
MSGAVPAEALGRVHFVGIGGAGMSGIARILLARGLPASGCDAKDSHTLAALAALGARVSVGHDPAHLAAADTVVASAAIRDTHPELAAARRRGLPVLPRAAALAAVMAGSTGVAVAGTHGKTTTTSMLTVALQRCGADPSFAIGGDLGEPGSNAHAGSGSLFVAEADESDGSFLLLSPRAAIVTNVEADHLDHYADLAAVERAFIEFARRIEPGGFLVVCADDAGARRVAAAAGASVEVVTYGESPGADLRIDEVVAAGLTSAYSVSWHGAALGAVRLRVPGRHNVLNSAAALTAGLALGFGFTDLADGLAGFPGARRRFEFKGTSGGVRVFDDYAHHPTEVAATLEAARAVAGDGRVVVVFQPHRYSRTAALAADFAEALGRADAVVVLEVYAAGEDPLPGVSGALVAAAVPAGRAVFERSMAAAPALVRDLARSGDVVVTAGAGDVTLLGAEILAAIEERAAG